MRSGEIFSFSMALIAKVVVFANIARPSLSDDLELAFITRVLNRVSFLWLRKRSRRRRRRNSGWSDEQ
jgi:hypothetical protein